MVFNWYPIFKAQEFLDTGLPSRNLTFYLSETLSEILITSANALGVQYLDTFLIVNFAGQNPYIRDSYAVYLDESDQVWFGIEVES